MLDLDGAIQHCLEKEDELKQQAGLETDNERYQMSDQERVDCVECAMEHRQLAEWLKELQAYRKFREQLEDDVEKYDGMLALGIRFCYNVLMKFLGVYGSKYAGLLVFPDQPQRQLEDPHIHNDD